MAQDFLHIPPEMLESGLADDYIRLIISDRDRKDRAKAEEDRLWGSVIDQFGKVGAASINSYGDYLRQERKLEFDEAQGYKRREHESSLQGQRLSEAEERRAANELAKVNLEDQKTRNRALVERTIAEQKKNREMGLLGALTGTASFRGSPAGWNPVNPADIDWTDPSAGVGNLIGTPRPAQDPNLMMALRELPPEVAAGILQLFTQPTSAFHSTPEVYNALFGTGPTQQDRDLGRAKIGADVEKTRSDTSFQDIKAGNYLAEQDSEAVLRAAQARLADANMTATTIENRAKIGDPRQTGLAALNPDLFVGLGPVEQSQAMRSLFKMKTPGDELAGQKPTVDPRPTQTDLLLKAAKLAVAMGKGPLSAEDAQTFAELKQYIDYAKPGDEWAKFILDIMKSAGVGAPGAGGGTRPSTGAFTTDQKR